MSISKAIKDKNFDELKKSVDAAVKIYEAAIPKDVDIDTVHGSVPSGMLFDDESKWMTVIGAYTTIVNEVSRLPEGVDKKVETAKLIATNAILRNITTDSVGTEDGLL